jgi:hypothetical protein
LTGFAVNVTDDPAMTGLAEALIETLAVIGLTIMVMAFDVAGELLVQGPFAVMIQVIASPLAGA